MVRSASCEKRGSRILTRRPNWSKNYYRVHEEPLNQNILKKIPGPKRGAVQPLFYFFLVPYESMEVLWIHCIVTEFLVELCGILCGIPQITMNTMELCGILHGTFQWLVWISSLIKNRRRNFLSFQSSQIYLALYLNHQPLGQQAGVLPLSPLRWYDYRWVKDIDIHQQRSCYITHGKTKQVIVPTLTSMSMIYSSTFSHSIGALILKAQTLENILLDSSFELPTFESLVKYLTNVPTELIWIIWLF